MDPTNPSFWERLGFPLATLILLGIVAFRVANWCKPWVERVFQGHIDFLSRTEKMLETQTAEQKLQSVAIRQLAQDMAQSRADTTKMAADIVNRLDILIEKGGHS